MLSLVFSAWTSYSSHAFPIAAKNRQFRYNNIRRETRTRWSASTKLFAEPTIEKVQKTDQEWQDQLSPQEYYVLRESGTEAPGSSELNAIKVPGTFVCRGCGAPLFTTSTKFDSGTGWPSFFQPLDRAAVTLSLDYQLLLPRTEVRCASCDGHLGHVFDDGPEPTGQRYCMNGVALKFCPDDEYTELAAHVQQRQLMKPYKPSTASQLPGIVFNGIIGVLFFASFLSRLNDLNAVQASAEVWDFFPVLPAIFYGVLSMQGVKRLLT